MNPVKYMARVTFAAMIGAVTGALAGAIAEAFHLEGWRYE